VASVVLCVLLDSWQVVAAQGLVARLHTYDIERVAVRAEARPDGLAVRCEVVLEVAWPGPLTFFLSGAAEGAPVRVTYAGIPALARSLAPEAADLPGLVTLHPDPPPARGDRLRLVFAYVWRPSGAGLAYYRGAGHAVQTHLSGFWLPTMADERFDAEVTVLGPRAVAASGAPLPAPEGEHRFRSGESVQVVALVAGDAFAVHRAEGAGRRLALYLPPGIEADPETILADATRVLGRLQEWFGPAGEAELRIFVEPRPRPAPSYNGGSFLVLDRRWVALARSRRDLWLSHLAHECSHLWWGHHLATPVVGRGGTWIREGLAQWSGIEVAGALVGGDTGRELYRGQFRGYVRGLDLRRGADGRTLAANEVTLEDATYVHPARVPYLRGALAFRLLARQLGPERLRAALVTLAAESAGGFADLEDLAGVLDAGALIRYYARTTRLPDLRLAAVETAGGRFVAEVRCDDPDLPPVTVPCEVRSGADRAVLDVALRDGRGRLELAAVPDRVEIDPERILLDPILSNNAWER